MSLVDWGLVLLLVMFAALYYALAAIALRDLHRRPSVRSGNKVGWALIILCIPVVGAILYEYMGVSGFLPRDASKESIWNATMNLKSRKEGQPSELEPPGS